MAINTIIKSNFVLPIEFRTSGNTIIADNIATGIALKKLSNFLLSAILINSPIDLKKPTILQLQ